MGVDYCVWIIPQPRAFRPNANQVASLANALREGRWAPSPGAKHQRSAIFELLAGELTSGKKPGRTYQFDEQPITAGWVEFHSQHELVLDWWINDSDAAGVQFPFDFDPFPDSGPPYFGVSLVLGQDYFSWTGENVTEVNERSTQCTCGNQLAHRTGYAQSAGSERIYRICPKCGREFDPSALTCDVIDGWTGQRSPLEGGLTYRFGMIVNCHKYWPREEEEGRRFKLRPEFLDLWRTHIGVPFDYVVTFD